MSRKPNRSKRQQKPRSQSMGSAVVTAFQPSDSKLLPNGVDPLTGRIGAYKVKGFEPDQAAVERHAMEMARLNVQRNLPEIQAQVNDLVAGLQGQIEEIRDQGPILPDPPRRHKLQQAMHRPNQEDPRKSWLKLSCSECPFESFTQHEHLRGHLENVSYLCDLPFGTKEECDAFVIGWQRIVAEIHNNTFQDRHVELPALPVGGNDDGHTQ